MAAPDGSPRIRPQSPGGPGSSGGFLFKGTAVEELERLQRPTSPTGRGSPGDSPARPPSAARTPRPASGQSGKTTRPTSAATRDFHNSTTDYAKHNGDRPNGVKINTFQTPAGLNEKNANVHVKVSKGDLYDICEQSFRRSVAVLTKDILREVKGDLYQSLELIRRDAVAAAEAKCHRDSHTDYLLGQLNEKLDTSIAEFDGVQKEMRSGEMMVLEGLRDMVLRLEGQLMQNIGQVRDEVQDVRKCQETSEDTVLTKLGDVYLQVQNTDAATALANQTIEQIAVVATMQETLKSCCELNMAEIHQVHELQATQHQEALSGVEAQFDKYLGAEDFGSDTIQIINQIKKLSKAVSSDYVVLHSEISMIQKALNVDFAQHVFEEVSSNLRKSIGSSDAFGPTFTSTASETAEVSSKGIKDHSDDQGSRKLKRYREYWSQTDAKFTVDAGLQTDKETKKPKSAPQVKTVVTQSATAFKGKTAAQTAAEKAKNTKATFADKEAMQAKLRAALIQPQYNVHDMYHRTGCAQKIATSNLFENITLAIIIFNAMWIAVDIDENKAETLLSAHPIFIIAENAFCCYYSFELIIRFLAFKKKKYALSDGWFMFDLLLVAMMIAETWVLTLVVYILSDSGGFNMGGAAVFRLLKMVKMVRISRMVRVFRAIPELIILIKAFGAAARSVLIFFLLWLIIIYVFAVVFRQLTEGSIVGNHYFPSVPGAMNTLLLDGIFPDQSYFVNDLFQGNPFLWPIIMIFILLAAMTLMYMLIGVLVDVVSVIACTEKEGMTVMALASQLRAAWEVLGKSCDDTMNKTDFQNLLVESEIVRITQDVGVDVFMIVDMADVLFEDYEKEEKNMTFENFVELMLKMRGGNPATVKDINKGLKVTMSTVQKEVESVIDKVGREFEELRNQLQAQAEATAAMQEAQMQALMAQEEGSEDGDEKEFLHLR